jgi:hypothetical protein
MIQPRDGNRGVGAPLVQMALNRRITMRGLQNIIMNTKFLSGLFEGDCTAGYRLSMGITGGDFWPRPAGCIVVYIGADNTANIDLDVPVAVVQPGIKEICLPKWIIFKPGGFTCYIVRSVNGQGAETESDDCMAVINFTEAGLPRVVAGPAGIFETGVAGDSQKILTWLFHASEIVKSGSEFQVFSENSSEPLCTVPFSGSREYSAQVPSAGSYSIRLVCGDKELARSQTIPVGRNSAAGSVSGSVFIEVI